MTELVIEKLIKIWKHERLIKFASPPDEEILNAEGDESLKNTLNQLNVGDNVFSNVVSSRIMIIMQHKPKKSFECFADLLGALIKASLLTLNQVNEQCVRLYKEEWLKVFLEYFFCEILHKVYLILNISRKLWII